MNSNTLEIKNLSKKIGKKQIIDDVSFTIRKGEIFGLLGSNGAGKTTIIRMIVGLIKRSEGKIIVNGNDLDQSFTSALGQIGAIVETPVFYDYLPGMKNLKNYARMTMNKSVSFSRIHKVVKTVMLEDAINQKVKNYSLGMRQWLGVAQALLHSPALLILDEPTNGLDPQGIREFREYIRTLADNGISVLISSHLLSEMQLMCDRFAIIEKGKLTYTSTMEETTESNNNEFTPVEFEVSDVNKAIHLLKKLKSNEEVRSSPEKSAIRMNLNRETTAQINQLLVNQDIHVYRISPVKATLEDRFLELTNKKSKEEAI